MHAAYLEILREALRQDGIDPAITPEAVHAAHMKGAEWRGGGDIQYYAGILEAALPYLRLAEELRVDQPAVVIEKPLLAEDADVVPGISPADS